MVSRQDVKQLVGLGRYASKSDKFTRATRLQTFYELVPRHRREKRSDRDMLLLQRLVFRKL
jgi:hypothetical protein